MRTSPAQLGTLESLDMNTTTRCAILVLTAVTLPLPVAAQKRSTELQLSDLPRLDWAEHLDLPGVLAWDMSPQDVEAALGVRLRNLFETSWGDQYDAPLSTTFRRQRVYLGLHPSGQQAFHFVNGRLFSVLIKSQPGWEDELLHALFTSFGPARYAEYSISGVNGERIEQPLTRTAPRTMAPVNDTSRNPELRQREYQWLDAETEVRATDGYCYNNSTRKTERCTSVSFVGWRVAARGSSAMRERYEQIAQDFLDWLNWWRRRR